MKKLIPILLIAFAPLFSQGQAYTPLNLDTSCFWIQRYYDYYAGVQAQGEVLQYVEKDTLIGPYKFHIIKGYCTDPVLPPTSSGWYIYNCYNPKIIIREDTLNKKIYRFHQAIGLETIWLDFNYNVLDTVVCYDTVTNDPCLIVDSINLVNHYGISSRTTYANWYSNTSPPFIPQTGITMLMEGIGMNYNFPDERFGEWGIPRFTLDAFVKNGTILYKKDFYPVDSCYRKLRTFSCWPLSVNDKNKIDNKVSFINNVLSIEEVSDKLTIKLISLNGQVLFERKFMNNDMLALSNYPTGIYILSLQTSKGIENRKILIR